jgi:hypothetical protein
MLIGGEIVLAKQDLKLVLNPLKKLKAVKNAHEKFFWRKSDGKFNF